MPVVFVHGVATRLDDDPTEGRRVRQREQLFQSLVLKDSDGLVLPPYWGIHGAKPSMQWASLPGGSDDRGETFSAATAPPVDSKYLAALAETDLPEAIDMLFALVFEHYVQLNKDIPAEVLDAAEVAAEYAAALDEQREANRSNKIPAGALPDWLDKSLTDEAFASQLSAEIGLSPILPAGRETYSIDDTAKWLGGLVKGAFGRIRAGASELLVDAVRDDLHPAVGRFLGDVFVYLDKQRGSPGDPGPIPTVVADALVQGMAARTSNNPLIVVGHSFGGIILVDILRAFQSGTTPLVPGLEIDALVTVGSQVGVFQELGVLGDSTTAPHAKVPPLDGVRIWMNVYDEIDILSFLAEPLFEGVTDYRFSSQTGLLSAHSAYFSRPRFYERLRSRLKDAGIYQ